MPTKKKSCELVHQDVAGSTPDQILEAIRAEYWLPSNTPKPREPNKDTKQPDQPTKTKPQVKS